MKIITFENVKYGWDGRYYARLWGQKGPSSLHRAIWSHHHGPIPARHHVHHKDGDTDNTEISNLVLMSTHDHTMHHKAHPYFGTAEHMSQLAQARRPRFTIKCEICGKEFLSARKTNVKFCSRACYDTVWNPHVVPKDPIACAHCGTPFSRLQRHQVVCSRGCHSKRTIALRSERRRLKRKQG